jgi:predicted dehydrogenase
VDLLIPPAPGEDFRPTRVAIIGLGQMARNHYLPALLADYRVDIAALVEPIPTQLRMATHGQWIFVHNPPAVFPSHTELLEAMSRGKIPPVDAAVVLTHPAGRDVIIEDLLAAGIHVLGEKPCAVTIAAAERLYSVGVTTGRILVTQHQYRAWVSQFDRFFAAELRERTTFGRLRWIRFSERRTGAFADPIHGLLPFDLGTHLMDPFSHATGWPTFVAAEPIKMPEDERLVHIHANLISDRGMVVEVRLSDELATRAGGASLFMRRRHEYELDFRLPTLEQETAAFRVFISGRQHGKPITGAVPINPPTVREMVRSNIGSFISLVRGETTIEETALTTAGQGVMLTRTLSLLAHAHHEARPVTIDELE